MKFIKDLSVRQRHILIIAVVILGFIFTGATAKLSNYFLSEYEKTHLELKSLKMNILLMNSHEKGFLSEKDMHHVDEFTKEFHIEIDIIDELLSKSEYADIAAKSDTKLKDLFNNYHNNFKKIIQQQTTIGLDHKSGLYGELRKSIHGVEEAISISLA